MGATLVLALWGGGLIVIGGLLTWLFRIAERDSAPAARRGIEVTGQVIGAVADPDVSEPDPIYGGGGGGGYAPLVSFRTRDGEVVAASSRRVYGPSGRVPAPGSIMRVRYDPGNPRDVYLIRWDAPARFMPSGLAVGGVAVTLIGAMFIVLAFTV